MYRPAVLALVEAGIDFTDQEDVVAIEPGRLIEELRGLSREIGASSDGQGVREASSSVPTAVLVGPPNAGKSTLFNALSEAGAQAAAKHPAWNRTRLGCSGLDRVRGPSGSTDSRGS